MPRQPLRLLSIIRKGSQYAVCEGDDANLIYTINRELGPTRGMDVRRASDPDELAGKASYHYTKRHFSKVLEISLDFPSRPGVAFNEKGGLFSSSRRSVRSPTLGLTRFDSRVGANPWKGGAPETTFIKSVSQDGQTLSVFRDERYDIKRIGQMEIRMELSHEQLDEIVVCTMAILFAEKG